MKFLALLVCIIALPVAVMQGFSAAIGLVWFAPMYAALSVINIFNFISSFESLQGIKFFGPKSSSLTLIAWQHDEF